MGVVRRSEGKKICEYIFSRGRRVGLHCTKMPCFGRSLCWKHNSIMCEPGEEKVAETLCPHVFSIGRKKGTTCGRRAKGGFATCYIHRRGALERFQKDLTEYDRLAEKEAGWEFPELTEEDMKERLEQTELEWKECENEECDRTDYHKEVDGLGWSPGTRKTEAYGDLGRDSEWERDDFESDMRSEQADFERDQDYYRRRFEVRQESDKEEFDERAELERKDFEDNMELEEEDFREIMEMKHNTFELEMEALLGSGEEEAEAEVEAEVEPEVEAKVESESEDDGVTWYVGELGKGPGCDGWDASSSSEDEEDDMWWAESRRIIEENNAKYLSKYLAQMREEREKEILKLASRTVRSLHAEMSALRTKMTAVGPYDHGIFHTYRRRWTDLLTQSAATQWGRPFSCYRTDLVNLGCDEYDEGGSCELCPDEECDCVENPRNASDDDIYGGWRWLRGEY